MMVRQVKIDVWISLVRSKADKIDWLTLVQMLQITWEHAEHAHKTYAKSCQMKGRDDVWSLVR